MYKYTGMVKAVTPVETKGNYSFSSIVLTKEEKWSNGEIKEKLAEFKFGGKSASKSQIVKVGDQVEVTFDVSSREYNGRHYSELNAWDVVVLVGSGTAHGAATQSSPATSPVMDDDSGDLPF